MWIAQGPALNSVDDFIIKVEGKQSHGAMPWAGSDATLTAANIVVALQQIVSRNADLSSGMGVITVGKLTAGETANVMSGKAEMVGTIRSNNADIRQTLLTRIPQVAEGIADAAGAKAITQIVKIYPVTMNNPQLVETMVPLLQKQGIDAEINNWNLAHLKTSVFMPKKHRVCLCFSVLMLPERLMYKIITVINLT